MLIQKNKVTVFFLRRVVGATMEPSLYEKDLVFAVRKKPKVGDIVIANVNDREVVKRVTKIGSPALYTLLGDNEHASTDSRSFGAVPYSSLIGVVIKTFKAK